MKILFLTLAMLFALPEKNKLTGRWATKPSEKGNITTVIFKADNSLEGFINRKPFTSGTYSFHEIDSTLSFIDNGCNGTRGTYKIMFYSDSDSLRFRAVSDSCDERKNGMGRLVMGRIK